MKTWNRKPGIAARRKLGSVFVAGPPRSQEHWTWDPASRMYWPKRVLLGIGRNPGQTDLFEGGCPDAS